jgi:8-oxo-dGTP pyrophosphatase MutT (NUDIX family)
MARIIQTAGLVVVQERKLPLAFSRNKQAWYLPGGKKEPGENDQQTLVREVQEELGMVFQPEELRFMSRYGPQLLEKLRR